MEVKNEVNAWDFDLACAFRLLHYDNETNAKRMKTLLKGIGAKFEDDSDPNTSCAEEW